MSIAAQRSTTTSSPTIPKAAVKRTFNHLSAYRENGVTQPSFVDATMSLVQTESPTYGG